MCKSLSLICAVLALGAALSITQQRACGSEWGEPSAAGKRIAEELKSPTELQFIETPLTDIIATFKDFHEIEIQIDRRALDDVGVPVDAPITKDLKGISLRSALRLMLRDLDLTYLIADEVLLITTREQSDSRLLVRVYPVGDLVGRQSEQGGEQVACDSLIEALTTCVVPRSWKNAGGRGSITLIPPGKPSSLIVRQSQRVHEEITDFLGNLRRAVEAKAGGEIRPVGGSPLTAGAEKRIAEELKSPTEFQFIETPLQNVIATIKAYHEIEIQIDQRALDDVGVPSDTAVTIDVKGVSLRSALRLILRRLDLTYMFRDEVLLITTPEEAEMVVDTRIYPLDDLVAGRREAARSDRSYHDGLVQTITSLIIPECWAGVGGAGYLTVLRLGALEALVVMQTSDVHAEVEGFLSRPEFRGPDSPEPGGVDRQRSRRTSRPPRRGR